MNSISSIGSNKLFCAADRADGELFEPHRCSHGRLSLHVRLCARWRHSREPAMVTHQSTSQCTAVGPRVKHGCRHAAWVDIFRCAYHHFGCCAAKVSMQVLPLHSTRLPGLRQSASRHPTACRSLCPFCAAVALYVIPLSLSVATVWSSTLPRSYGSLSPL